MSDYRRQELIDSNSSNRYWEVPGNSIIASRYDSPNRNLLLTMDPDGEELAAL